MLDMDAPFLSDQAPGWQARAEHVRLAAERQLEEAPAAPAGAIAKIRYSHDAMIDLILQSPGVSQNQLAANFGYTPAWVSQIMSSDAFKARLEQRREELIDPAIRLTLNEKFNAMVHRSIDVLQEKLMQTQVDPNIALRAAELGVKALGVGGYQPPAPAAQADRLAQLANRLTGLLGTKRSEIIDV